MKKTTLSLVFVAMSLLTSCNKDFMDVPPPKEDKVELSSEGTSGKYLRFKDQASFDRYYQEVKNGGNLRSLHAHAMYIPKGFKSIAELKEQQARSFAFSKQNDLIYL